LKRESIDPILSIFKKDYENSFKIESVKEYGSSCDIEITISQPKRTHYIQQAYLRNFSSNINDWLPNNDKKKARIFVYDKLKEQIVNIGNTDSENKYGQKIENIAFEEYFYSLSLEKFLADTLEKEIPPIFNKLTAAKTISSLKPSEKETIVKYLILTWNRPTETREHIKESFEKGIIEAIKMNPKLEVPKNAIPVMNEDYLRFHHESQILRFLDSNSFNFFIKLTSYFCPISLIISMKLSSYSESFLLFRSSFLISLEISLILIPSKTLLF